jgi:two-component system, chemotaxis family, chemotaxis protein CheY
VRVLIMDDSIVIRRVVESVLRQADLGVDEVVFAADGAQGLELLERAVADKRELDLILSDLHMPGMDGLEFLLERRRRGLARGVPVVMITADGGGAQVAAAMAAGAEGFISKPFTLDQIRGCIESLLPVAAGG